MDKALELEKFTTLYIGPEDRIRVAGTRGDGSTVALWLTRRLMRRVLPHMVAWLERHDRAGKDAEVQSFRQQVARANHQPQPPVKTAPGDQTWLVDNIDLNSSPKLLRLTFKGKEGEAAALTLTAEAARQWLNILHIAYQKGEWPTDDWPSWLRGETQNSPPQETLPN